MDSEKSAVALTVEFTVGVLAVFLGFLTNAVRVILFVLSGIGGVIVMFMLPGLGWLSEFALTLAFLVVSLWGFRVGFWIVFVLSLRSVTLLLGDSKICSPVVLFPLLCILRYLFVAGWYMVCLFLARELPGYSDATQFTYLWVSFSFSTLPVLMLAVRGAERIGLMLGALCDAVLTVMLMCHVDVGYRTVGISAFGSMLVAIPFFYIELCSVYCGDSRGVGGHS